MSLVTPRTFRFSREIIFDPKNIKIRYGKALKPFLFLRLDTGKCQIYIQALIDTGADTTIIPGQHAEKLGHALKGKSVKSDKVGFANGAGTYWLHTVDFDICDNTPSRQPWLSWQTLPPSRKKTKFLDLCCHDYAILGVDDFLEEFDLHVNYQAKTFTLSRVSNKLTHLITPTF